MKYGFVIFRSWSEVRGGEYDGVKKNRYRGADGRGKLRMREVGRWDGGMNGFKLAAKAL